MSITFGYDLKDGDKILEASKQLVSMMRGFAPAGMILMFLFPFCAVSDFIPAPSISSQSHCQCDTFLHGSHTLATNHWPERVGS
jgi:hypothetical protein